LGPALSKPKTAQINPNPSLPSCSSSPGRPSPPLATPSPISHEETKEGNPPGRPSPAHGAPLCSLNLSYLQDAERTAHDKGTAEEAAPMIPEDIQGCSPTTQRVLPSSLIISPGHHHVFRCSPSNPNPRV
ncbi:hypothetical protein U9M48_031812, partial [Paspalum notatum var. saurae]